MSSEQLSKGISSMLANSSSKLRASSLEMARASAIQLSEVLRPFHSTSLIPVCCALANKFKMALVNVWHLRRVADASAKPCDICYKPTTSVLITPDNKV